MFTPVKVCHCLAVSATFSPLEPRLWAKIRCMRSTVTAAAAELIDDAVS